MMGKLGGWGLVVLLAALTLGVAGAGGRSLTTTTLAVQVVGGGRVTSNGGQITCGAGSQACFYSTAAGSGTVVLTANDQGAWSFDSWSGAGCSGSLPTCTFTLNGTPNEIIATFTSAGSTTSTLSVNTSTDDPGGDGGNVSGGDVNCDTGDTSDCTWDVPTGSTVTMVESPDSGFIFGGWSGGLCSGTAPSCTVTMDVDHSISAAFRKPTLTVHVTGNGTVTGAGIVCTAAGGSGCTAPETADADVTLTATPGAGGSFTDWTGACTGKNAICTITMTADKSATATFSGGGGTTPSTFPLSVSVTGNGTVTGGGLNCGVGGSVCSQNVTAGFSVTLTATPESGSTFTGWGGACSGSSKTCTVTMSSARNVTATFSGGSSTQVTLSVAVTGHGRVTGGGITCGNGATACSAKEPEGATVGLTASPAARARFTGWGGACSGAAPTCTVTMSADKNVTAGFRGGSAPPAAGRVLKSRGAPTVRRLAAGFDVTLRFSTTQAGHAHIRALRAGRLEAALSFSVAPGKATIGPFPLADPGYYAFELTLGSHALHWNACLGVCGKAAPGGPFVVTREAAGVLHAGAAWSVTVHFRASHPSGASLRIYRGRKLAKTYRFAAPAGLVGAGPFVLSPGTYLLRLAATDAYGRLKTLAWYAFLP
jgi:hypothetical protein